MRDEIANFLAPYLPAIYKVIIFYVLVLIAVIADLWSGIRKSRKAGKFTHSFGIDRTLSKLASHYNLLLCATVIDALIIVAEVPIPFHDILMFPWFTFLLSLVIIIKEIKSIWEKEEDKGRYIEAANIATMVANKIKKEDLLKALAELAEKQTENNNETN